LEIQFLTQKLSLVVYVLPFKNLVINEDYLFDYKIRTPIKTRRTKNLIK